MIFFVGLASLFAIRVRGFLWTSPPSLLKLIVSLADVIVVVVACAVGIEALSLTQISVAVIGVWRLVLNNMISVILFKNFMPE